MRPDTRGGRPRRRTAHHAPTGHGPPPSRPPPRSPSSPCLALHILHAPFALLIGGASPALGPKCERCYQDHCRKKDSRQSIHLNTNAFSLQDDGTVYVAKAGNLKVKWSRRLPAARTSLTVTKDSCGRYFLSFVVDTGPDTLPEAEAESGIDLGLPAFAVLSDGRKIDSPRFLRRAEKKLKRLQRELSRRARGSKNRAKARINVARRHAKVADRRRDFHHKASTQIIRDSQAVYVEDLAVSGLGRTRLADLNAAWPAYMGTDDPGCRTRHTQV